MNTRFDDLKGAVIIGYNYLNELNSFKLITDTVNFELTGGYREFVKTVFTGVYEVNRIYGLFKEMRRVDLKYNSKDYIWTIVLDEYIIEKSDENRCKVNLYVGEHFGSIQFYCEKINQKRKIGRGVAVSNNEWDYFDEKNSKFDFYDPFND